MPERDYTKDMESVIEGILAKTESDEFEERWGLAKKLLGDAPVRAFYAFHDGSYVNLAILTDKSIMDIEADDEDEPAKKIAITLINSIGEIHFHPGPVQTLSGTADSQLTLVLLTMGESGVNRYWFAESDLDERHLTRFGQALMKVINAA